MSNWKIPLFEPDLTEEDALAASAPIRRKWLTMGEETARFEAAFADRLAAPYAVAVSSCTAALHMALLALDIRPGDEALMPSLTFVACANVARAAGAIPLFVDAIGEDEWSISPDDLARKITPRSRVVIALHYAGFPCRMNEILAIAREKNLFVIEDCAHALVSDYAGRACGLWSDVGCFSFFSNKNMTTGEGGMAVARDEAIVERLRWLRSHGMTTLTLDRHRGRAFSYDVRLPGFNYRMDEPRAALGLSQLRRLDANLHRRRELYGLYREALAGVERVTVPLPADARGIGVHIMPIALPPGANREAVMRGLKSRGIQSSIHYPPIHRFTAYRDPSGDAQCPLTEAIAERQLTLPFYPGMSAEEVRSVCRALGEILEGAQ